MSEAVQRRVLIIGGGAGGLAAAVAAGEAGAAVTLWEMANRVGKKLLRTGNGRCNLTNENVAPGGYNRPGFVAPLLARADCAALLGFFTRLGLYTVTDGEGRVYPRSDTAASVLDVLRAACARLGVAERCCVEAVALKRQKDGWQVTGRGGESLFAHRVIIAAGGGTTLPGPLQYEMVPFSPALCPLRTDTSPIRGLSGLRVRCAGRLLSGTALTAEERGELLFRDYGVSGIMALDLSRFARAGDVLSLDLLPELSEGDLAALLADRDAAGLFPAEPLTGLFHRRVGEALVKYAGGARPEALSRAVKDFRLTVLGPGDAASAQVTRGGAAVGQFDPLTLESRRDKGLYMIGEALDIDGRCGGYNLHWAFVSGLAAGRSAAE